MFAYVGIMTSVRWHRDRCQAVIVNHADALTLANPILISFLPV